MTLKELYARAKKQGRETSPAAAFVREVAEVTKKSEIAVRRWLSNSISGCEPDALTQEVLARHFGTTADELFPSKQ